MLTNNNNNNNNNSHSPNELQLDKLDDKLKEEEVDYIQVTLVRSLHDRWVFEYGKYGELETTTLGLFLNCVTAETEDNQLYTWSLDLPPMTGPVIRLLTQLFQEKTWTQSSMANRQWPVQYRWSWSRRRRQTRTGWRLIPTRTAVREGRDCDVNVYFHTPVLLSSSSSNNSNSYHYRVSFAVDYCALRSDQRSHPDPRNFYAPFFQENDCMAEVVITTTVKDGGDSKEEYRQQ